MLQPIRARRILTVFLGLGAAAWLIAIGSPHSHEGPAAQQCRFCRVQQSVAAAPSASTPLRLDVLPLVGAVQPAAEPPSTLAPTDLPSPRAPPVLS